MPTILILDDSCVQVRARQAILRSAGFESHTATTAECAFAALRIPEVINGLSAVVTDHVLQGCSGVDFVRELRRLRGDIAVIVVTGAAEAERDYAGLNVVFREKPCPPRGLISLVRLALKAACACLRLARSFGVGGPLQSAKRP